MKYFIWQANFDMNNIILNTMRSLTNDRILSGAGL